MTTRIALDSRLSSRGSSLILRQYRSLTAMQFQGESVAVSDLDCLRIHQAIGVQALAGAPHCVLWQDTLLLWCLFLPR